MNTAKSGVWRTVRLAGAGLVMLLALSACGVSKVDGVSVTWPPFREGTPVVLPSDPAQCPDLTGLYRAQGEFRSGDRDSAALKDLRKFLYYPLDLPGMRDDPLPEWQSTPEATVAFTSTAGGWDVQALDGRGARSVAHLALLNGAQDPASLPNDVGFPFPNGIQRHAGCIQGRLWISVRHDWRQHESMGVRRNVALLRPEAGGLLVTVQHESDWIGLLPWYFNEGSTFQYWFAPASQ
ncbi:hypothetical protein [Achromobacter pestifer]